MIRERQPLVSKMATPMLPRAARDAGRRHQGVPGQGLGPAGKPEAPGLHWADRRNGKERHWKHASSGSKGVARAPWCRRWPRAAAKATSPPCTWAMPVCAASRRSSSPRRPPSPSSRCGKWRGPRPALARGRWSAIWMRSPAGRSTCTCYAPSTAPCWGSRSTLLPTWRSSIGSSCCSISSESSALSSGPRRLLCPTSARRP